MTRQEAGLDFTPRPGPAPLLQQVLAQAGMEARLMLRNGEQLLLAVVIPVIVLLGGVTGAHRVGLTFDDSAVDTLTPGVLALAVMSTAFTSLAIATGFERRYGVIKRLGSSPLPRTGLLAGKVGALLLVELLQLVVIGAVALALGWQPATAPLPAVVGGTLLAILLGTAAFASLGLFLAGSLRAEATLAAANLVYLLLMAGGAVVLPASVYGGWGAVAQWLPSGALGEAMRAALVDGTTDTSALLVLAGWAIVGSVLTARTFKWE
jgi:ABC-2 type transport system permease protein